MVATSRLRPAEAPGPRSEGRAARRVVGDDGAERGFEGEFPYGGGDLITDGATQWMTAGRGILHIETPPEELVITGRRFHEIQLWVNLREKDKFVGPPPNLEGDQVALLSSPDGGAADPDELASRTPIPELPGSCCRAARSYDADMARNPESSGALNADTPLSAQQVASSVFRLSSAGAGGRSHIRRMSRLTQRAAAKDQQTTGIQSFASGSVERAKNQHSKP
jgi:Pirin